MFSTSGKRSSSWLFALIILWSVPFLWGDAQAKTGTDRFGVIEAGLRGKMDRSPSVEFFRVTIHLEDSLDLRALAASLDGEPRSRRLKTVILALQDRATVTQADLIAYLESMIADGHVTSIDPLWIVNAVGATADREAIHGISALKEVREIREPTNIPKPHPLPAEEGPPVRAAEWNIDKIRAPELWDMGYRGEGIVIGSFDTGVDVTHPDLSSRYLGGDHSWYDPYDEHETPYDSNGHGTHTTGTVLGGDNSGKYIGVAPGASFIAAKAWRDSGSGSSYFFHLIFQWFLDPDGDPGTDDAPHVVSNSWAIAADGCLWDFGNDILAWRAAGIFPSFATGNDGPGYSSALSPGNYVESFGVGATDSGDRIAGFSGRGPSACDEDVIKPEACAPGVSVKSCLPGNSYASWSGTSMATPHVTGAVALLLSAYPDLSVDEMTEVLKMGAVDLGSGGPDNNYGWGRIDLVESMTFLQNRGTLSGYVIDSSTLLPLKASVEVLNSPYSVDTGPDGFYSFDLAGDDTHTIRVAKFGYFDMQEDIYLPAGGTIEFDFPLQEKSTGSLRGTVADGQAVGLADARVSVLETPIEPVFTDSEGEYFFDALPEDQSYLVKAEKCTFVPEEVTVDILPDSTITRDFTLYPTMPDDVESGDNGWSHGSISYKYFDEWHISSERNNTTGGAYSWRCADEEEGLYADYCDAGLVTHCFDVEPGSTLRFWHFMRAERNLQKPLEAWDGGLVEVSDDWGETWTQVEPEGGYPYFITANPASPFEPGTMVFSGAFISKWKEVVIDLAGWEGDLFVRFRFGSDGLIRKEGWYIDDITVRLETPDIVIHVIDPPLEVHPGEETSWELEIINNRDWPEEVDLWLVISGDSLPPGHNPEVVFLKGTIRIPPNYHGIQTLTVFVPSQTPAGMLTVESVMGLFPDDAYTSDSFDVPVVDP